MGSDEEFWAETLRGSEATQFPSVPVNHQPFASATYSYTITKINWPSISSRQHITSYDPSTIVQLAWATLIAQYTNSTDIVIGRVTEHSLIPMRIQLDWQKTLAAASQTIQENNRQVLAHSNCHLGKLRAISSDTQRACEFQFVLGIRDEPAPGSEIAIYGNYALSVVCKIHGNSLSMQFRYDPIVLEEHVLRFASQLDHLVHQLVREDASTRLSEVNLLSSDDRHQIWSGNMLAPPPVHDTLCRLLAEKAAQYPESLALDSWDGHLTYRQLIDLSYRLSCRLVRQGVLVPGRKVLVCTEKSLWTTVIILAIARQGGVFIALDPALPLGYLSRIAEDSNALHILCTSATVGIAQKIGPETCTLSGAYIQSLPDNPDSHDYTLVEPGLTSDMPLYVVYTSGSSGAPKGAVISHSNLCSNALYQAPQLGFNSGSRSLDYSSYSFDAYVFNTFYTLFTGGCLCVPSDQDRLGDLQGVINRMGVTLVQLTPSVARLIEPHTVPDVQTLILTGEKIQSADLLPWLGRTRVVNAYGPSECTIMCSANLHLNRTEDVLCIGSGLGCNLWLQDVANPSRLALVGAIGEIVIEGPNVGLGYLGQNELTQKTQVRNPVWLVHGPDGRTGYLGRSGVVHRTGDLARYNMDGTLSFVGRVDTQTKLHGQRIDTTAVESELRPILPVGTECAVEVVTTSANAQLLVGFLSVPDTQMADRHGPHMLVKNSRELLASRLPAFMVPSVFWLLDQIPMTTSGKINRRELRSMAETAPLDVWVDGTGEDISPSSKNGRQGEHSASETESCLRRLWTRILGDGAASNGLQDSFFLRGGDSISAIRLSAAAAREGYKLDVPTILRNPKLSDMASRMGDMASHEDVVDAQNYNITYSSISNISQGLLERLAYICQIQVDDIEDAYPCSPIQEAMLAMTAQRPGSFVMQKVMRLPSVVDLQLMKQAWDSVVKANPILRTRIVSTTSDGLIQIVVRDQATPREAGAVPTVEDLHSLHQGHPLVYMNFIPNMNNDLSGNAPATMILTMHHALYDAWSIDLLMKQLIQAYEGTELSVTTPYCDFVSHVAKMDRAAAQSYWAIRLATTEAPQFPVLPSKEFQPLARNISMHFVDGINWPSALGITPSTMIRAAYAVLQASYTNSSDVVFGATVIGRQYPILGIERLVGPTIATTPVRVELDWASTVQDFLVAIQTEALNAIAFEQYDIARIRQINHGAEQACQFQTLLVIQPYDEVEREEGSIQDALRYRMEDEDIGAFSTHALTIICFLKPTGLEFCFSFDDRLLPRYQVQRMASQMEHIVRQFCMLDLANTQLKQIEVASPADMQQIWTWNSCIPESSEVCVHETIAATAAVRGDAIAIDGWDGKFSYAKLLHTATRLAAHLQALGIGPEVMTPTLFEKSAWAAVAMLAVIIAGGVGVAVDVSQPEERLRAIVAQTGARLVLASPRTAKLARSMASVVLVIDGAAIANLGESITWAGTFDKYQLPSPRNALFIVFTSGSTGTPKGAVITHSGFSTATKHQKDAFGMTASTRVLDFASYAFDVAWFNLLHTLSVGGCLCIPSDEDRRDNLVGTIKKFNTNYLFLTPSLGRHLDSECAPTVKDFMMGGEGIGHGDMEGWADDVRIRAAYGPAECTVMSHVATFQSSRIPDVIHTGPGLGLNCWVQSCFNSDKLAPLGAIGELVLEGPLIGRGYLGDPDKTAKAFTFDPSWLLDGHAEQKGRSGRVYRTGDLVKLLEDGSLVIIGRKDAQVKLRGQRVELEEVETYVRRLLPKGFPGTLAAEVVMPAGQKAKMLALFIASPEPMSKTDQKSLLRNLAETLPIYMVPSIIVSLDHIPTTTTGKINRKGLREMTAGMSAAEFFANSDGKAQASSANVRPPVTEVEKQLHALWAQVLGQNPSTIGLEDNFLHVGGDSISAMRLAGHAHEQGLPLSVAAIFRNPQLKNMAQFVSNTLQSSSHNCPEPVSDNSQPTTAVRRHEAQALACPKDVTPPVYPTTEFQRHSLRCAELRPRAEWGFFSIDMDHADVSKLVAACSGLYHAIEIFRTVFPMDKTGSPTQALVLKDFKPDITVQKVRGSVKEAMYDFCREDVKRDLSAERLLTAFAIFCNPSQNKTRLVIRMSHAHYDGLSLHLIMETLGALYEQRAVPHLTAFSEYIRATSERAADDYQYWRKTLQGASMSADVGLTAQVQAHSGASGRTKVSMSIPRPKARHGITAATIVYASWARVLASLLGSADVVFGRLVSGRNHEHARFNRVVGPCISYAPIRASVSEKHPDRLLEDLQDQYIRGLPHESIGISEITKHCTDWPAGTRYGSTVHYQNIEEEPSFLLGGSEVRLNAIHNSGEADAPGCTRVTVYPTGATCKLELSMAPETAESAAHSLLEKLAASIEYVNKL